MCTCREWAGVWRCAETESGTGGEGMQLPYQDERRLYSAGRRESVLPGLPLKRPQELNLDISVARIAEVVRISSPSPGWRSIISCLDISRCESPLYGWPSMEERRETIGNMRQHSSYKCSRNRSSHSPPLSPVFPAHRRQWTPALPSQSSHTE